VTRAGRQTAWTALRLRSVAAAFLAVLTLTACAGISRQELDTLGSRVTPAQIDFAELSDYGYRARAAYRSEAEIRKAYPRTTRVAEAGQTGVRYFLEQDDARKVQYIVVRGTANKQNMHEDMEARLLADQTIGIPVHSGFDDDAQAVYADVKPYLKKGYATHVTGHSLGGAVGSIIAIYAIEDGHNVVKVVTFGQPRFTTAEGVKKLGFLPLMRVVDENDVIPMLPPSIINKAHGPYDHVGPEVILLEGPRYVYLTQHDASRLAVGEFWRSMGVADLPDHKMDNYLKRLSSKTKRAEEVAYNQREKYTVKPARPPAKTAATQ
jgi:hypothetical protein